MKRQIAILLLFALPAAAQVPYIESMEVRVHNIDVVVTDAKGQPVTGLTRDDFQLFEDGEERELSNFSSYADMARASAREEGRAEAHPTLQPTAPPARKFIFYVDEMALTQPTAKKLKAQFDRLFRETVREGDEAMVVRPHEQAKLRLPFSRDAAAVQKALLEALDHEKWRATSPHFLEMRQLAIETRGAGSWHGRRIAARRYANFVKNRVQQRLGQLRAIVNAAAELPGRKVLVLATESMPLEPGKEAFQVTDGPVSVQAADGDSAFGDWSMLDDLTHADWVNLQPLVDEIARSAATGGITIYAVQPEYGIGSLAPGGDIDGPTPGREAWDTGVARRRTASQPIAGTSGNPMLVELRATNTEGTLRTLAEKTGGTWRRGGQNFDNLVNEIVADVSSYYSLGYRAGGDYDTPHKIEVRVKGRPELHVRARKEVIRKSPEREMTDRVVASLLSPPSRGEVPVRLEYKTVGTDRKTQTMWVAAHVPLSALSFIPDGDKLKASFSVHYAVAGERSDFTSGVHGTQVVEVPQADVENIKTGHWTYVIPLNMNRARYTVAVGVMDTLSHAAGFGKVEVRAE